MRCGMRRQRSGLRRADGRQQQEDNGSAHGQY
jgi:hypothetical protein